MAATVPAGELGQVGGMPVIISQYRREELSASGIYDGTTTNTTGIPIAHRGAGALGDRLQVPLEAEREARFGQDVLSCQQAT